VLFGEVSPSGRLPVSFPVSDAQTWLVTEAQHPGTEQPGTAEPRYVAQYTEGLHIGYRWFDANPAVGAPLFEFGFGLSYSAFAYSGLAVAPAGPAARDAGAVWSIEFEVRNTGKVSAREVAQLYLGFPEGAGEPPKQLRGFERTALLRPGEAQQVRLPLKERDLRVWSEAAAEAAAGSSGGWVRPEGAFRVMVGASSRDVRLEVTSRF
jgi:beta-glucosidase